MPPAGRPWSRGSQAPASPPARTLERSPAQIPGDQLSFTMSSVYNDYGNLNSPEYCNDGTPRQHTRWPPATPRHATSQADRLSANRHRRRPHLLLHLQRRLGRPAAHPAHQVPVHGQRHQRHQGDSVCLSLRVLAHLLELPETASADGPAAATYLALQAPSRITGSRAGWSTRLQGCGRELHARMKAKRWPCCRLHCANRRAVMRAGAARRVWLNKRAQASEAPDNRAQMITKSCHGRDLHMHTGCAATRTCMPQLATPWQQPPQHQGRSVLLLACTSPPPLPRACTLPYCRSKFSSARTAARSGSSSSPSTL